MSPASDETIVHNIIEEHKGSPVDILGIGGTGEYDYLRSHEQSYTRTVRDIDALWTSDKTGRNILEVGAFLGVTSIALKKMGYSVCALDIPEFHNSASLRCLYEKHGVPFVGLNLRKGALPYASGSFDAVVSCEVVEHLNFNPLPVLREINRVLKKGGFLYNSMPNQTHVVKRARMLLGKSVHDPIEGFFQQLDRKDNMIVGLHWREYTLKETVHMLEAMGFQTTRKYYCAVPLDTSSIRALVKSLLYVVPSFRPYHVVIGKKVAEPVHDFWITDANS